MYPEVNRPLGKATSQIVRPQDDAWIGYNAAALELREEIGQAARPLFIQLTEIDVQRLRYLSRCGLELFELRKYIA